MLTLDAATDHDVIRCEISLDPFRATTHILLEGVGAQVVAVDPRDTRRLFVGTFDHGILASDDGGDTWRDVTGDLPTRRVSALRISRVEVENGRSVVYAGTEPSALYRTTDDGASWQTFPAMLALPSQPTWSFPPRPWTSHVRWIEQHPNDPATIYVAIELGGVLVSRDSGATWEDHKRDGQADAHALATHPLAPDRLYAAAGGGVARSDDGVRSWQRLDSGMDRHYCWGLAVDPADPDCWYVSAARGARTLHSLNGDAGAVLYRKRGAADWETIRPPQDVAPYVLLTVPDQPGLLLAAMHNGELRLSLDHGDSWQATPSGASQIISAVLESQRSRG